MTWILIDPNELPQISRDVLFYSTDWIDDENHKGIKLGYIQDNSIITSNWNFNDGEYYTNQNDLIPHAYMEIPEFKT